MKTVNLSSSGLVDGNFKMSTELCQIYTNQAEWQGFAPSCVYVLRPSKIEKTNSRMTDLLSEKTNPKPRNILAQFQKAALNAFGKNSLTQKSPAVISN